MSCTFERPDGPCRATPQKGRPFCFFHDPQHEDARRKARSEGGKEAARVIHEPHPLANAPDVAIQSEEDVLALVALTVSQLRRGELEPDVARTIGQLCAVALKAQSQSETDERLKKLEEQLRPLKGMDSAELMKALREGQARAAGQHDS